MWGTGKPAYCWVHRRFLSLFCLRVEKWHLCLVTLTLGALSVSMGKLSHLMSVPMGKLSPPCVYIHGEAFPPRICTHGEAFPTSCLYPWGSFLYPMSVISHLCTQVWTEISSVCPVHLLTHRQARGKYLLTEWRFYVDGDADVTTKLRILLFYPRVMWHALLSPCLLYTAENDTSKKSCQALNWGLA